MLVGTQQLADLIGLSRHRISQLVKEGMPKKDRGKFEASESIQWYITFRIKGATVTHKSTDVNEARKKLYDAQVVKTELETARIKRETIPADEHMIDMNQLAVMFSSGLEALEGRLPGVLLGVDDPAVMSETIRTETTEIRTNVADAITAYTDTISNS